MSNYTFLIGIGAQKAGTTWLANYFTEHKDICMSHVKELHYFDAKFRNEEIHEKYKVWHTKISQKQEILKDPKLLDCINHRVNMIDEFKYYLKYFEVTRKQEKVVCEITPSYSLLGKKAFNFINKNVPNVKILFC